MKTYKLQVEKVDYANEEVTNTEETLEGYSTMVLYTRLDQLRWEANKEGFDLKVTYSTPEGYSETLKFGPSGM